MNDIFKDTKWWMYFPFISLIKIRFMADWVFEEKTYYMRANRFLFIMFSAVFLNIIYSALILGFFLRK